VPYAIQYTRRARHRIDRMPGPRRAPLIDALDALAADPGNPDTSSPLSEQERRCLAHGCVIDYYLLEEAETMLILAVYVTYSGLPDDTPPPMLSHPHTPQPANNTPVTL
jgi:hypothetical protein